MSTARGALAGRRILVTRSAADSRTWATRLRRRGAVPVVLPCVRSEPIADAATASALRTALHGASWAIFTSRRSVVSATRLLAGRWPATLRCAAVGPATAAALSRIFALPALVPRIATAAGLGDELATLLEREHDDLTAVRVVVVGAEAGRDDLVLALERTDVAITRVMVYRTIAAAPRMPRLDLDTFRVEQIWVASPSAVTGLRNQAVIPPRARIITIGPSTTAAAQAAGLTVSAQAETPTLLGMVQAAE